MKKICFFIGSRANYGRLKTVIDEAVRRKFDVKIILGAQGVKIKNFKFNKYVEFKIDGLMHNDTHSNMVFTTSIVSEHISNYLSENKPDMCFVHADRYENLGFAIAAAYNNIPLIHSEGGEKSGCIDDKVRNAISALSDVHFVVTEAAACQLTNKQNVFITGSPAIDYLASLDMRYPDDVKPFGIALYHPNTTKTENYIKVATAFAKLCQYIDMVWVNPNVDPGNRNISKELHTYDNKMQFVKNLSPEEFYTYLYNCNFIVGNSSAGIKEAAYLGVPSICVGDRQDQREKGMNCIDVPIRVNAIETRCMPFINNFQRFPRNLMFGDGSASKIMFDSIEKMLMEGRL